MLMWTKSNVHVGHIWPASPIPDFDLNEIIKHHVCTSLIISEKIYNFPYGFNNINLHINSLAASLRYIRTSISA